jgi:plastocyanin
MATPSRFLVLGLVAVLAFAGAACSDDDDGGDNGAGGAEPDVSITGLSFSDITVTAGQELVIANESSAPHTFTSEEGDFDSEQIDAGSDATVTAPSEPGDYEYFCSIHPDQMRATMTVE